VKLQGIEKAPIIPLGQARDYAGWQINALCNSLRLSAWIPYAPAMVNLVNAGPEAMLALYLMAPSLWTP
jgi:hypothetical protein